MLNRFKIKPGLIFFVTIGLVLVTVFLVTKNNAKPKTVIVSCQTTKGPLEIVVVPEWSPHGAQRFLQLVDNGHFSDLPLFRCVEGFLCQFGAKPEKSKDYDPIPDDPQLTMLKPFKPGYLSFAGAGPNSRSTHAFIALAEVKSLGSQPWETPFGFVTETSFNTAVKSFFKSYGEMPPFGKGPDPVRIVGEDGKNYLHQEFPQLDWFKNCFRK